MPIVSPAPNRPAFQCPFPHCGIFAKQTWNAVYWVTTPAPHQIVYVQIPNLRVAVCDHCHLYSIWYQDQMVFPAVIAAVAPHTDMPQSVLEDYEEARRVFGDSPRSSAALLRLAIQKTCIELGLPGKNLNDDIGELVKTGLPVEVQRALDIVRVIGNNQVHPGVLDVRDDADMATRLFELVNVIVEDRIARPKHIADLYAKLPEGARKQIEERDAKGTQS